MDCGIDCSRVIRRRWYQVQWEISIDGLVAGQGQIVPVGVSGELCVSSPQLAQGYTAQQCADILFLSLRTLKSHKYRMLDLLKLDNHTELIQFMLRNGVGIDNPWVLITKNNARAS